MATTSTSNDLTHHYRSPYMRPLPHYRTCLPSIARSCNPFVRSRTLCPRRIVFLLIALMRIVQTSWYLFLALMGLAKSHMIWVLVLICVTAFSVELWNLHLIVEAEGDGTVCGRRIPAGAFSLFCFCVCAWHLWMVPLEVSGMAFYVSGEGTLIVEGLWIATICLVAWTACREPEEGGLSLA